MLRTFFHSKRSFGAGIPKRELGNENPLVFFWFFSGFLVPKLCLGMPAPKLRFEWGEHECVTSVKSFLCFFAGGIFQYGINFNNPPLFVDKSTKSIVFVWPIIIRLSRIIFLNVVFVEFAFVASLNLDDYDGSPLDFVFDDWFASLLNVALNDV